ncbi:MAG: transposase [Planctomycetaceae bacterium]
MQTLCRALQQLCLHLKKVLKATELLRPDVDQRRLLWSLLQVGLDPKWLVFFDETWAKTNMTRPRGRALQGQRLVCHAPFGHWKTTTFFAGLRLSGLTAPLVIDGALNGAVFVSYLQQHLAPTLNAGDILIMDILASHKVPGVREAV